MCGKQITCDLLSYKFAKGNITIEGIDHIITITPCVIIINVAIFSIAISIAGDIEPMPSPFFAKMMG